MIDLDTARGLCGDCGRIPASPVVRPGSVLVAFLRVLGAAVCPTCRILHLPKKVKRA